MIKNENLWACTKLMILHIPISLDLPINIRCLQIPTFKLFRSYLPSSHWCNLKIEMILLRRFLFQKIS